MNALHKSELVELKARYESDLLEANKRMLNIERLSRLAGRGDELENQFTLLLDKQVNKKYLEPDYLFQWWSNDFENVLTERFDSAVHSRIFGSTQKYQNKEKTLREQEESLRKYRDEINKLVAQQHIMPDEMAKKVSGKSTPLLP